MSESTSSLPRMFDLLQIMIAAIGEESVDAAVASLPADILERDRRLQTLLDAGRDTQVLTEACAVLIRRRSLI